MPIYEYQCEQCGERFELFVRSSAQRTTPICPKCGSAKVQKAVSLVGVAGTGSRSTSSASCQIGST
jgi:putative FmdB family regulatory protein